MHNDRTCFWLSVILVTVVGVRPLLGEEMSALAANTVDADDFSPMAAFMIMMMAAVFCLLLGIGVAIGVILCVVVGALVACGILSTSVVVGFLRRSPTSGFRAFFFQAGIAGGIVCGICVTWFVSWMTHNHWSVWGRLWFGGGIGLVCGALVAQLFNYGWTRTVGWILAKWDRVK